MSLTRPNPFLSKWAEKGLRFDVPNSGADTAKGRADIQTGFPEITMKSPSKGGVPPWGQDHNSILYKLSEANQWTQAGGYPSFNQELCNAIGGYPVGSIIQGNDTSKPWVLWINQVDGNKVDPNGLKINTSQLQNGWVRYPVISGAEGSILYFTDEGKLEAASATITSEKWVSSSLGNNTNNGIEKTPFASIDKAISDTPGSGAVTIYLLDKDTHYWSSIGEYKQEGGWIVVGSRKVQFKPYDVNGRYKEIEKDIQQRFNDGTNAYCLSDSYLASQGLARPKVVLVWKYAESLTNEGLKVTNTQFMGINGTNNDFAAQFYGVYFSIDRVDELSRDDLPLLTGWGWNGGNYQFIGCRVGKLPNKGEHYLLGGGGDHATSYSFPYRNYFEDGDNAATTAKLIAYPSDLSINVGWDAPEEALSGTEYIAMKSNSRTFLGNKNIYYNGLDIIKTPSARYAYIHPNFEIK